MRAKAYTDQNNDGFLLDRTREEKIEGRYIEKYNYTETIRDPFGQELRFERTAYRQVEFTLHREYPQLEIRNAPRATNAFMSRLGELTDFTIGTSPINANVLDWAHQLQTYSGQQLIIERVQLDDLPITEHIIATMMLASDRDIRPVLQNIINGRGHHVAYIRVKLRSDTGEATLQLAHNGTAKLDDGAEHLLPALRKALGEK